MKLSCTPISLRPAFQKGEMDMERFIALCAEQKLDGIDLLDSQCYAWAWKDAARERKALPQWLDHAGLKLAAYSTGNNFAKQDPGEFAKQVALVKQALREAADLGATTLRIFGGYHEATGGEKGVTSSNGLKKVIEGIAACLPEAEKLGVSMALENHGRLPGHSFELLAVMRRFNSPFVRCTADCANFMANSLDETENPVTAVEALAPWISHVHVKDVGKPVTDLTRRVEACVAGCGYVPLRQCAAALERAGYTGYCSLEYEAHTAVPAEQGVPASLAYLCEVRDICGVIAD